MSTTTTFAGIALSRVAGGAPFALTTISSAGGERTLSESTTGTLAGNTPAAIVSSVSSAIGNGPNKPSAFSLAFPIGLPDEQRKALRDVNTSSFDHLTAIINLNESNVSNTDSGEVNFLFIDLTPGQVAFERSSAELDEGSWLVIPEEKVMLTQEPKSAEGVINQLVAPIVPPSTRFQQIALFPSEDSAPAGLLQALQSKYPNTLVKWVSLAEISRGAALCIQRRPPGSSTVEFLGAFVAPVPIGITLANGKVVTAVQRKVYFPSKKSITLTTSRDNQTSVTVNFVNGTTPAGKIVLEGITPKPKGTVRIQVTLDMDYEGKTVVTVEESGTENKKVGELTSVLNSSKEEMEAYVEREEAGQTQQVVLGDEVGALPA
ncbi:hypothetical protein M408DRAFT_108230 [Serendipita vermifera MAFF 305830]|uniref:Uncharacterized protein n=1 Tax=Serendipita vermifera MAFF 305830 TaxID=933852 RepID=A0A0C3BCJ4_SERVB|nr:hypothetical protein M408DRAFT_108230 [Serendipita vermifera MAFF 305830]